MKGKDVAEILEALGRIALALGVAAVLVYIAFLGITEALR